MNRPIPKPTYENELLTAARAVARLQAKRRSLRRRLREVEAALRHERRMLRALATRDQAAPPDVAPSRLFGGATGIAAHASDYPADWPRCACGRPVLDGHLTCGEIRCNESNARAFRSTGG
jgi:hypothetical protein